MPRRFLASCERLVEACTRLNAFAIIGMLESIGDRLFNACVLVGPSGIVATYRKIHLPFLGVDRFTDHGDRPFAVHSVGELRVGMNICYDGMFPESACVMALDGADLIVLPTNFPPGTECVAAHVANMRAIENHIYYACVNRVGMERGFQFIGQSKICDPSGCPLAEASHANEEILYADINVQRARSKRIVRIPEKHIIDLFKDRRPDMYRRINSK